MEKPEINSSTAETIPQKETTQNQMDKKYKIIVGISIGIAIAAIIICIIVSVTSKKDNKDEEEINTDKSRSISSLTDYYISDDICEGEGENRVCYRIINQNIEHYIFNLSDNVDRTHVRYRNRYGIEIAGDLYTNKNINKNQVNKAIVVGPPYGGVKEQGPGIYCNELANRGFVCLAFDPSFNGESGGGWHKHISSTDIFAEDFSAGVDYLGTLSYVDRNNIGGIGICGSGGFLLSAAAIDKRIKAVATAAMYDIPSFGNNFTNETWQETITNLAEERWRDVDNGLPTYIPSFWSDREYYIDQIPSLKEGTILDNYEEWYQFYVTTRGHHPRATGGFTQTSITSINNFPATYHIDKIAPRPILFISGETAHSLQFSEDAYSRANEPKELYIVEGDCMHIDLYNDVSKIPFDKLEDYFNQYLK